MKGTWIDINSLDDLGELAVTDNTTTHGEYTGGYDSITHTDIRAVLTRCGFSDEMITYIVSEKAVSLYQLADVICRAPVTLDEKMYLLRLLIKRRNLIYEAYCSVIENLKQENGFSKIKNDLIGLADFQNED